MRLILASQSSGRRAMLQAAGVPFEAMPAELDENAAKLRLKNEGVRAAQMAERLAELKALSVSARRPGDLVLGCDSVVELQDGRLLDKAESRDQAAEHLRLLSNRRHYLHSAAVIAEDDQIIWRCPDRVTMHVRALSDAFIDDYLDREWEQVRGCVGGYRVEGPGAQLFTKIDGSQFTVIGLPLLPLLGYLRERGVLAS
jgi:septum formation protein